MTQKLKDRFLWLSELVNSEIKIKTDVENSKLFPDIRSLTGIDEGGSVGDCVISVPACINLLAGSWMS
jgi:hypothetical protein